MKKPTLADKLAEKAFQRPDIQKSWTAHMQTFGPILEHAFKNDYQARIHLTAALNHLSRKQLAQGLTKLMKIKDACVTDRDRDAYLFFMGLYCELAGDQEKMIAYYQMANEGQHSFYLPYMKLGKIYLGYRRYDHAEENYRAAIDCFTARGLDAQEKIILGSAYTNLASCLLMTHRYVEAESALATSRSLCPDAPGRSAVEAMVYAILGETARMEDALAALKTHAPAIWPEVNESIQKVLRKEDPIFFPVAFEAERLAEFWGWFASQEAVLKGAMLQGEPKAALVPVAQKLLELFPFLEEPPLMDGCFFPMLGTILITLKDLYSVGLRDLFQQLLGARPAEIPEYWQFEIIHYDNMESK